MALYTPEDSLFQHRESKDSQTPPKTSDSSSDSPPPPSQSPDHTATNLDGDNQTGIDATPPPSSTPSVASSTTSEQRVDKEQTHVCCSNNSNKYSLIFLQHYYPAQPSFHFPPPPVLIPDPRFMPHRVDPYPMSSSYAFFLFFSSTNLTCVQPPPTYL
jgi:hypothetical protein